MKRLGCSPCSVDANSHGAEAMTTVKAVGLANTCLHGRSVSRERLPTTCASNQGWRLLVVGAATDVATTHLPTSCGSCCRCLPARRCPPCRKKGKESKSKAKSSQLFVVSSRWLVLASVESSGKVTVAEARVPTNRVTRCHDAARRSWAASERPVSEDRPICMQKQLAYI